MVLSMSQLFHALNLRSLEHSLFRAGPFKNRWLILTVLFGIVLQVIVCELPAAQLLLGTVPSGWNVLGGGLRAFCLSHRDQRIRQIVSFRALM